jgi:hypothetical protein
MKDVGLAIATLALTTLQWLRAGAISVRPRERPRVLSRYARGRRSTAFAVVTILTQAISDSPAPDVVYKTF